MPHSSTTTSQLGHDPGSTAERVYAALTTAIIRAELRPGEALSEADIAKRFAVSRQPVREAFIRLEAAGLVAIRPYRGTFVLKISNEAVREGRFVREAVEVAIVRELASLDPQPDLSPILANMRAQLQARPGDHDPFMALDEAFHRALAETSGHVGVWRVVERAKAQMDRVRYLSLELATPMARLVAQHEAVVDALVARDPDAAEAAIRAHLQEISTALPKLYGTHPDLFEAPAPSTPLARGQTTTEAHASTAVGAAGSSPAGVKHR